MMMMMMMMMIVIINKLAESQLQGQCIVKSAFSIQQLEHPFPFRGMDVQIPRNRVLKTIIAARMANKFLSYMDPKGL
jgi:hypothetical protein